MRWAEHEACVGEMRNAYKILVRKPFGRLGHKWKDSIKILRYGLDSDGSGWCPVVGSGGHNSGLHKRQGIL
jgi:hypothetical protein